VSSPAPEPSGTERERLLAEAVGAYVDLRARGEAPGIGPYCAQHAAIADDLRAALETFEGLEAAPPQQLSGARILREIGAGGMGRVFLASDESLGRLVAIKTMDPACAANAGLRERFLREARALARLSHPNIVRIYNLGPEDEPPHFVMEYLEGAPLTEAARPLPLGAKIELLHKVALAVEFLHQHHLVHRDLKPGNILVGQDLEPKLLDLGLALPLEDGRMTLSGEVMGTPNYFSPEQARAAAELDARSDVFSLGVILYELLTGRLPFGGGTVAEQIRAICEEDPVLPRRLDPAVPGALQNICLQALEKDPAVRYASAREMASDLERYLAGEPVMAAPASYSRLISGRIEQHLRELGTWRRDHVISDFEFDAFRKAYDRLTEREDAWIMEVRRLSFPQVALYLGAWMLILGAALVALFRHSGLERAPAVALAAGATLPAAWAGLSGWKAGHLRVAVAYLLSFCLLAPLALAVFMYEYGLFTAFTRGDQSLELFGKYEMLKRTTNAQMWWAILLSLPVYAWLRRFTRSSVFSLVFAVMAALLSMVTLLRMGMLEWIDKDPGQVYLHLLPFALLFLAAAITIERLGYAADSRYFYPIAVAFTWAAFSGVAGFHEPYARWLKSAAPWTRGQVEYLFLINAVAYLALQMLCDAWASPQMRNVARAFRFVIPSHVLFSLLLLGLAATDLWQGPKGSAAYRFEARLFEALLPVAACGFVFLSIPKQMKNYLAAGMLFLAIGAIRLEEDLFQGHGWWPVSLVAGGLLLMFAAAQYARLRLAAARLGRRLLGAISPPH
jgi:Protein kinase domain